MTLDKIKRGYVAAALLVFNSLLFLACLNIGVGLYGIVDKDAMTLPTPDVRDVYIPAQRASAINGDFDMWRQLYYYYTDTEILRLMVEGWGLGFVCDSDVFFRVKPTQGTYYNVDPAGFRQNDPRVRWVPESDHFNIFLFGGSTTYGIGVADNLTIASWLQWHLREAYNTDKITVYNFGVPSFASLQERWSFEALIQDGIVPDLAVFIDGVNDFTLYEVPIMLNSNTDCSPPVNDATRFNNLISCEYDELCLPIQRFATSLDASRPVSYDDRLADRGVERLPPAALDDEAASMRLIERWLDNKHQIEALADTYNIPLLFIIQPVPTFAYDLQYHLQVDDPQAFRELFRFTYGYPIWVDMYENPDTDWTGNVLNLARLSEGVEGTIYVSGVHYTADFSNDIAQAIRDAMIERDLIDLDSINP